MTALDLFPCSPTCIDAEMYTSSLRAQTQIPQRKRLYSKTSSSLLTPVQTRVSLANGPFHHSIHSLVSFTLSTCSVTLLTCSLADLTCLLTLSACSLNLLIHSPNLLKHQNQSSRTELCLECTNKDESQDGNFFPKRLLAGRRDRHVDR
jgi:hypothetical protein